MHKNARLTPKGREVLVQRLAAGQSVRDVAQAMGVSEVTVRKWRKRFADGEGLEDRSSRPRTCPRAISQQLHEQIAALRRLRRTGRLIAQCTGLSAATISRSLRKAGLNRWRDLEPSSPAVRYERDHPGELVHLDTKKLGCIRKPAHRVTGDPRDRGRGGGWEFVHVAVDDCSRVAHATMTRQERKDDAVGFLEQVVAYYRRRGVRVQRVMTDNGGCYRSHAFGAACQRLGVRQVYTRAYRPQTNGKAERFIQTALREWAYAATYENSKDRTRALAGWLHHYNWHRPHTALGGKPPVSRLQLSRNNLLKLHT